MRIYANVEKREFCHLDFCLLANKYCVIILASNVCSAHIAIQYIPEIVFSPFTKVTTRV